MITLSQLTELLGWASIINISYLLLATIIIVFMRGAISSVHSKMFRVEGKELDSKYFDFLWAFEKTKKGIEQGESVYAVDSEN